MQRFHKQNQEAKSATFEITNFKGSITDWVRFLKIGKM